MRDYQVQGLNWLVSLYENGINGILADEMGLGKTLQTISFLGYLRFFAGKSGPHLVIVPKSTIHNWAQEFKHWLPEIKVLVLQGEKQERQELIKTELLDGEWDVTVTSYEMIIREKSQLKKFAWEYIIIDEAHRIKNEESLLSQVIREFNSRNRLLITGTPLQNNLHELWSLLNFLLPDVFSSSDAFDNWFSQQAGGEGGEESVIKQLHKVLRPFLLRRVKADVEKSLLPKIETNLYVGMSEMQILWYKRLLEKDIDAVNGAGGKKEGKTRLLNICMQLRKCCNHPYLFDGAEPGPPYVTDERLIQDSGKLVLLDKLLKKYKAQGSRVLIFSQMSRVLDILEDYCYLKEYEYCRIDGQTAHEDRISAIDEYNKSGSSKFLFLLTTRAGGLGINLTTADIVVLFDSDWNPQADLQAMDRAHRIGQTKQVYVYRFVTDGAIEEKILERAAQKLRLDQLVIQQGRQKIDKKETKEDLLNMVQHGATEIFSKKEGDTIAIDDDFDNFLAKGAERTRELNKKFEGVGVEDLQKFVSDNSYEWNGNDYAKKKTLQGHIWIEPTKRERKGEGYNIDAYYSNALKTTKKAEVKQRAPRPPKQIHIHDHQFYSPRLAELQDKETAYFQKEQGYKVPLEDGMNQQEVDEEQAIIDAAVPLTKAEIKEKETLATQGFANWARKDFFSFIRLAERYGRSDVSNIAAELGKTQQEVREYAKVLFSDRMQEIEGHERYLSAIEAGEERIKKSATQASLLRKKIGYYKSPMTQLKINYAQNKGKVYTEDEDRFLLVKLNEHGMHREDIYDVLRNEIRESAMFRFDWFIKSRTTAELQRRCTTLLNMIVRELGEPAAANVPTKTKKKVVQDDSDGDTHMSDNESVASVKPPKKGKTKASGTSTPLSKTVALGSKANGKRQSLTNSRASTPATNGKKGAASPSSGKTSAKHDSKEEPPKKKSRTSLREVDTHNVAEVLPPTLSGRQRKRALR